MASLVWGLESWVGYDVRIPELREGRMSGPPRARGRRGFWFILGRGTGVAVFVSPPPFLGRRTTDGDRFRPPSSGAHPPSAHIENGSRGIRRLITE